MIRKRSCRILVAVDGSDFAMQTATYLSGVSHFIEYSIDLFHVFDKVPESYYDLSRKPPCFNPKFSVMAWESQQRSKVENHLEQCRQVLLDSGYHPDHVVIRIQNRREGIARDIIAEARRGYDALIIGRRGKGRLHRLVMGNVASKLLNGANFIPLVFCGQKPFDHRVLIAMDGSDHSMRAVAYAGSRLGASGCRFKLLNVLRGDNILRQLSKESVEIAEAFEHTESSIAATMEKAVGILSETGVAPDAVDCEIVRDAPSRSAVIVQTAVEGKYGTVVLGRKGRSSVREFAIGRVSSQVLQIGEELGVWIVQ